MLYPLLSYGGAGWRDDAGCRSMHLLIQLTNPLERLESCTIRGVVSRKTLRALVPLAAIIRK